LQRKMTEKLLGWKRKRQDRLPLILYGARQVGKTYLLEEFGNSNYKNTVYVNFEQTPSLRNLFDGDLAPERIIKTLEAFSGKPIIPEQTLIIFDEIQACARALTALKYFAEAAGEFHIVAAGSLLGVAVNREQVSFPVGKVEIATLHPCDFEEFLWALGKHALAEEIRQCYKTNAPLNGALHEQADELFKTYLCTGGMPAVVNEYIRSGSLLKIPEIQMNILTAYLADMAKYASSSETVKTRTAFDSIPAQLAKENHKFQYKQIKKGASASHFGSTIDWLKASGTVLQCRRIEQGLMPPAAYVDISAFKLFMADTGLLLAKAGVPAQAVLLDQVGGFKAAIAENYMAQVLAVNGHELYYWESDYTAEVDFVIIQEGKVIPLEVKSSIHTKAKSLNVFMQKYDPAYAIRVSTKNFGFENRIKSVPLYAAFCILS